MFAKPTDKVQVQILIILIQLHPLVCLPKTGTVLNNVIKTFLQNKWFAKIRYQSVRILCSTIKKPLQLLGTILALLLIGDLHFKGRCGIVQHTVVDVLLDMPSIHWLVRLGTHSQKTVHHEWNTIIAARTITYCLRSIQNYSTDCKASHFPILQWNAGE